jgi:hypothetical protein
MENIELDVVEDARACPLSEEANECRVKWRKRGAASVSAVI